MGTVDGTARWTTAGTATGTVPETAIQIVAGTAVAAAGTAALPYRCRLGEPSVRSATSWKWL